MHIPYFWNPNNHNGVKKQLNKKNEKLTSVPWSQGPDPPKPEKTVRRFSGMTNSDFLMHIPYFWNPNNHNELKKQLNKKNLPRCPGVGAQAPQNPRELRAAFSGMTNVINILGTQCSQYLFTGAQSVILKINVISSLYKDN